MAANLVKLVSSRGGGLGNEGCVPALCRGLHQGSRVGTHGRALCGPPAQVAVEEGDTQLLPAGPFVRASAAGKAGLRFA